MATIADIQKRLDNRTLDPFALTPEERNAIDSAIDDGLLKGPKTMELMEIRRGVAEDIAQEKRFQENPIQEALDEDGSFLKGRPGAVLAGDLTGVGVGYKMMSGRLFGAAKNGNLWTRGPLTIGKQMDKVGNVLARGPGPLKLFGGALKLVGKAADLPERVVRSPLGQAEIVSTLTGAVGAAAGSITYDGMNKAAGKTIAGALVQGLADLSDQEIKTNMTYNAANEFKDSLIYGGAASAFTPFLTGVLGKVGRKILPTKKGPDMDNMLDYIKENDLPAPFIAHLDQNKGAGRLAANFFKTAGVFPGIASMGESAISKAEIAGANLYLNQFLNYAPLLKVSAMSSAIYNQVAKTYNERIALIGSSYAKLHADVAAAGNPKLISLERTKKEALEFIKNYKDTYIDLTGAYNVDFKNIAKVLQNQGDSMYLYYNYLDAIGDVVSPSEYLGLRQMLNKALQQTDFQTIQRSTYGLINALEDDWMTFGANITKGNLLRDESIKKTFDEFVEKQGKEAGETYIKTLIDSGKKINDDLIVANQIFNKTINRYTNPAIIRQLQQFDKTLFTNKGTFGIVGREALPRDKLFDKIEQNVFQHGTEESIQQFKYLLGAGPKLVGDGLKDAGLKANGEAVFNAARARYLWNNMLEAFESKQIAGDIYRQIDQSADVKIGRQYTTEFLEMLQKQGGQALEDARGFTIKDVETGNGIYNIQELRLNGDQVAQFSIKKFLDNLGYSGKATDATAQKLKAIFGDKKHFDNFMNFTRYMDSISQVKISDPSTFLMRRFQLGALGAVAGGYLIGSGNEAGLLAPLVFLLLGRKFGQILGDPVAARYLNDALGVDEKIKLMKGQKIGAGVAPVLPGLPEKKFRAGPGQLQKVGVKQRDAFARLFNYLNEQDRDVPRVDANDIKPAEITDRILKMSLKIPKPIYDDNTIPKETTETMFAGDLTKSSGNVDEDNDMVTYLDTAINNVAENAVDMDLRDQEADARAEQEGTPITDDLQLQAAGTGAQNIQQNTGQVTSAQVESVFPRDETLIAAARRREKPSV